MNWNISGKKKTTAGQEAVGTWLRKAETSSQWIKSHAGKKGLAGFDPDFENIEEHLFYSHTPSQAWHRSYSSELPLITVDHIKYRPPGS